MECRTKTNWLIFGINLPRLPNKLVINFLHNIGFNKLIFDLVVYGGKTITKHRQIQDDKNMLKIVVKNSFHVRTFE
jgi:hypothetical protein